jgi:hypothetical protein
MKETYQSVPAERSLELDGMSSSAEKAVGESYAIRLTPDEGRIKVIIESGKINLNKDEVLDDSVRSGLKTFNDVALALDQTNRLEIWVDAGHAGSNVHFKNVYGISKSHADRLIIPEKIAAYSARQTPNGIKMKDMEARNESRVRALAQLEAKERSVEVWYQALRISGGQPKQETVAPIVSEMIGSTGPKRSTQPSLRGIVQEVIARIRILFVDGRLNQEIQRLLDEVDEAAPPKKPQSDMVALFS